MSELNIEERLAKLRYQRAKTQVDNDYKGTSGETWTCSSTNKVYFDENRGIDIDCPRDHFDLSWENMVTYI